MSLFLPEYLDHLRDELDEDGDDVPADCDDIFLREVESNKRPKTPRKALDIPPGPLRIVAYSERFFRGEAIFLKGRDFSWDKLKVRGGRKVTRRHPKNGNPLEAALMTEAEVLAEQRAREAARKAVRDAKAWWREIITDRLSHLRAQRAAQKAECS